MPNWGMCLCNLSCGSESSPEHEETTQKSALLVETETEEYFVREVHTWFVYQRFRHDRWFGVSLEDED